MPTYTVSTTTGALNAEARQRIATEITRVHNEVTGAQTFFAQVIFVDVAATHWFIGGRPVAADAVFVHGQIRGGRSDAIKRDLLAGLLDATAAAAEVPKTSVWVYLVELPATQMAEYGHVLPQPGAEAQWLANLPVADRRVMESSGS